MLSGLGTSAGAMAKELPIPPVNYHTQLRRVLPFPIDGKAALPPAPPYSPVLAVAAADFRPDPPLCQAGTETLGRMYMGCNTHERSVQQECVRECRSECDPE